MSEASNVRPKFKNALVVDDEPVHLERYCQMLKSLGVATVTTAGDGLLAMKELKRMAVMPDLIVTDLFMPNADGIEFISALSETRFVGQLVICSDKDLSYLKLLRTIARAKKFQCEAVPKQMMEQSLGALFD